MNAEEPQKRRLGRPAGAARVQLNSRISAELDERMRDYQARHGMTRQTLLVNAIEQYLDTEHTK